MVKLELPWRDFARVNRLLGQMGCELFYDVTPAGAPTSESMERATLVEMGLSRWRLAQNHGYSAEQMDALLALATLYQSEQRASSGLYKNISLRDLSCMINSPDAAASDLLSTLKGAFYPAKSMVYLGVAR